MLTGPNFGCGSSCEDRSWALLDFGVQCIIGNSYADIFFNNTFKKGISPISIPDQPALLKVAEEAKTRREIEVDLVNYRINAASGNELAKLEVEEFREHCLVNGLDDVGLTMEMEGEDEIKKFESERTMDTLWLDSRD